MADPLAPIRALIEPCELLHQRIDNWLVTPTGKEIDDPVCLLDDAHRFLGELSAILATVQGEIDRLTAGKFTAEEIHNFCHNLHGTVSLEEFAAGCAAEQKKLYGRVYDLHQ